MSEISRGSSTPESARADRSKFELAGEAWKRRNTDLLLSKIVTFMEKQGFPSSEVREACDDQKKLLHSLFGDPETGLKDTVLFHGTGKSKYVGEKYTSGVSEQEVVPVLPNILHEGLLPHHDTWAREEAMTSLSLAKSYFYGKFYALKYEERPEELKWQFGDHADWVYYFVADSLKSMGIDDVVGYLRTKAKKMASGAPGGMDQLTRWLSSLRQDVTSATTLRQLVEGHSTIPDNWGAVVCIDKEGLSLSRPVGLGAHEVRTKQTLSSERIRAIGVPMVHHDEAVQLTKEAQSPAAVFDLEAADVYLSQFPLSQLVARF